MKKFRDQTRRYLTIHRSDWLEEHDRIIQDYLSDDGKVAMFVTGIPEDLDGACRQVKIQWNLPPVLTDDQNSWSCSFFIKMEAGPYVRPDQFDTSFFHGSYLPGSSDLVRHWTKVGRHFEQQALMSGTPLKELKHLMEVSLLKLRLHLVSRRALDEAVLLKPSLVPPPPPSDEDDEDRIELLERKSSARGGPYQ